jgi:phosphate acetyltransferase
MKAIHRIIDRARADPQRIALCEAEDPRVLLAAQRAIAEGVAHPILVGDRHRITASADDASVDLRGITLFDPEGAEFAEPFAEELFRLREAKGCRAAPPRRRSASLYALPTCWCGWGMRMALFLVPSTPRQTSFAAPFS